MKINNFLSFFLVAAFLAVFVSCSSSKRLSQADQFFESGGYWKAKDYYEKAYGSVRDKTEKGKIAFQLAECYRNLNDQRQALSWYRKAIRYKHADPLTVLYAANSLKSQEKLEDAAELYETYAKLVPDDPRGADGLKSIKQLRAWTESPTRHIVEEQKDLNSKGFDFSPAYSRKDYNEIYFTSTRESSTGKKTNNNSGSEYADIFYALQDRKGKWSEPNVVVNEEINSVQDEGAVAFANAFRSMYFTSCRPLKDNAQVCKIYVANRTEDGWASPEMLNITGDSLLSVGHPAVSEDELDLFFVTDGLKTGSERGGKDIWRVTRQTKGGDWSSPQNLGRSINTEMNELFPYWQNDTTIYFSSDGHVGMGGLDIYKATLRDDGSWNVANMKSPINSSGDDFGITFQGQREAGLFTSSRNGRGGDDIYSFELPELHFALEGIVKNDETGELIASAMVKLMGSDGTSMEKLTAENGSFKFNLAEGTDYLLQISKNQYFNTKGEETTRGLVQDSTLKTEILMTEIRQDKTYEVSDIYYDFGKADLRPESMVSLDKLSQILLDNPKITIELGSHTDYVGQDADNQKLSQARAQSVVDYLISKSITKGRLVAKGYGETVPRTVDEKLAAQYAFVKPGDLLGEDFIKGLEPEFQEIANQLNRRTEFKVLSTDYDGKAPKAETQGDGEGE